MTDLSPTPTAHRPFELFERVLFGLLALLFVIAIVVEAVTADGASRWLVFGFELAGLLVLTLPPWRPTRADVVDDGRLEALVALQAALAFGAELSSPSHSGGGEYVLLFALVLFRAGRSLPARRAVALAVGVFLSNLVAVVVVGHTVWAVLNTALFVGLGTAGGLYLRSREDLYFATRDRADQAEREQQLLAREAVAAERVRIARELHDVVAHHVSLLVVQAGAVRESLRDVPDHPSREVLDSMITGGRQAMAELRQMLDALRPTDGEPSPTDPSVDGSPQRSPQPDVADLPALVDATRTVGLPVDLQVTGEERPIPAGVSMAVFRIVQEALTNVVKHAPGAPTTVAVHHASDHVAVRVINAPPPFGARVDVTSPPGPGHGLVGMRERASLWGGEVTAGPLDGGYDVHARLPLHRGAPTDP